MDKNIRKMIQDLKSSILTKRDIKKKKLISNKIKH